MSMLEKNNILFVNTHYIPDYHYGGVVESGSKIFKKLRGITNNISLITVSKSPVGVTHFLSEKDKCCKSLLAHRWGFSLGLIYHMWLRVRMSCVVFSNGTVTFPTILSQFYALILNKPYIVSLRGAVEPWRMNHKKWKKFLYYKIVVIPLLRRAKFIHVTAQQEMRSLDVLGIGNYFIETNGIDPVEFYDLPDKFSYREIEKRKFVFLFMSRMDKEKGLELLIDAYKVFVEKVKSHNSLLCLAGPDNNNYLRSLEGSFDELGIVYMGGVYGDQKISLIRRSDIVILPSYNENFGNIIAESLASERPVITTIGTPWKDIENIGCGYYVSPTVEQLSLSMVDFYYKKPSSKVEMGLKGREYVFSNYNWDDKVNGIFSKIIRCCCED